MLTEDRSQVGQERWDKKGGTRKVGPRGVFRVDVQYCESE